MRDLLLVMFGGALGSGARYLVSLALLARLGPGFPWGTFAVNVVGSGVLGALMQLVLSSPALPPELRLFVATGFLGGFTTYSSFNYDTLRMLQDGNPGLAVTNVLTTLVACLASGWAGMALVRSIVTVS